MGHWPSEVFGSAVCSVSCIGSVHVAVMHMVVDSLYTGRIKSEMEVEMESIFNP